jgi:hypothetical protein
MMICDSISIGSLCLVAPNKSETIFRNSTLWMSSDPTDSTGLPIEIGCIALVLDESFPYVKVLTPRGLGWIYFEDAQVVQ